MGGKPTYEELEQRVKDLERASVKRKQSEEALRESEEKYRSLVSLSPDPIFIVQDGRHIMVSSAFTELFGYTQQDVDNGLSVLEIIQEDYKEVVRMRLEDRFAGKAVPQKFAHRHDGKRRQDHTL